MPYYNKDPKRGSNIDIRDVRASGSWESLLCRALGDRCERKRLPKSRASLMLPVLSSLYKRDLKQFAGSGVRAVPIKKKPYLEC